MPRKRPTSLSTIWRAPDDLWRVVERILTELDPPKRTGRKRIDARGAGRDHLPPAEWVPVEPTAERVPGR